MKRFAEWLSEKEEFTDSTHVVVLFEGEVLIRYILENSFEEAEEQAKEFEKTHVPTIGNTFIVYIIPTDWNNYPEHGWAKEIDEDANVLYHKIISVKWNGGYGRADRKQL